MSMEQQMGEIIGEMRGVLGDLNKIVSKQDAQATELATVKTDLAVQKFRLNLGFGVGVFFAGIIVPSVWAIILASVVNKEVISELLSFMN